MTTNDFSQFKRKGDLKFEFQIEEGKGAKVYVAKTTNMELLLIQENIAKTFENEADRTLKMFEIFLGKEDAKEIMEKVNLQGLEEILMTLMAQVTGVSLDELKELGKELDSPSGK